jgi:hypothetical protein
VIEVGRPWGTPSLYALVSWEACVSNKRASESICQMLMTCGSEGKAGGATVDIWKGGEGMAMPKEWNGWS